GPRRRGRRRPPCSRRRARSPGGRRAAPLPETIEEAVDRLPRLLPSVEAFPVEADMPDELVTGIDGGEVALVVTALTPVDEQRLDVRLQRREERVGRHDL